MMSFGIFSSRKFSERGKSGNPQFRYTSDTFVTQTSWFGTRDDRKVPAQLVVSIITFLFDNEIKQYYTHSRANKILYKLLQKMFEMSAATWAFSRFGKFLTMTASVFPTKISSHALSSAHFRVSVAQAFCFCGIVERPSEAFHDVSQISRQQYDLFHN